MGKIILRNNTTSGSVPLASEIDVSEIVLNTTDGRLYTKNPTGNIILLNPTVLPNVISSSYAVSSSYSTNSLTASFASNISAADWNTLLNRPSGIVSSSIQINSGSFSGSFIGSASYATIALSASFASNVTTPVSVSFASNSISASAATSITFTPPTASYALTVDWTGVNGKPVGIVSASSQINTGSFSGSFTGNLVGSASFATNSNTSISASSALTANSATSASFATSANTSINATSASAATSITFTPPTASYAVSTSFASVASTATSLTGQSNITISGTLSVSGNIVDTGFTISASGFSGSGANIFGIISSSYANSSSYSLTASYAANSAGAADWNTLLNRPDGIVSSSVQINTGSFSGSFVGSASYALTASFVTSGSITNAISASYARNASTSSIASTLVGTGIVFVSASMYLSGNLEQQDTWYISSSNFIGNGSNIVGIVTSSYALSSSYAAFAQNIAGTVGSASYSITASYAANSAGTADWNTLLNKPSGIVSSSTQINTGSFSGSFTGLANSASYAVSASYALNGGGSGISSSYALSASYAQVAQTVLGSISSATSASYALSASYASSASYAPVADSASVATTLAGGLNLEISGTTLVSGNIQQMAGFYISSSDIRGVISSSYAVSASAATSITFTPASSSYAVTASYAANSAGTADWNTLLNRPVGIVSSSTQINTGSFTGSFTGNLVGSASFATNSTSASAATSITFIPTSASYAVSASAATSITFIPVSAVSASYAVSSSAATSITFTPASSSYALSASFASNAGTPVSTSYALSSSYALSASYSPLADSASVATTLIGGLNLEISGTTLVSGNIQQVTGFYISSSDIRGVISSSYAISASYAPSGVGTADWNTLLNRPAGIVSSSTQINTGSFSGSFIGNLVGSASYATNSTSASAATSITFVPPTASYASSVNNQDWTTITNKPSGLVSSSVQVNTGSFQGSFSGSHTGSSDISTAIVRNQMVIGSITYDAINPETLKVSGTQGNSVNIISGYAKVGNYVQLNIRNLSSSISASSDVVATADNGTETSNYIDMGINSSQFGLVDGTGPNDAYLVSTGNDLHIANMSSTGGMHLSTGGTKVDSVIRLSISASGQIGIGTTGSMNSTLNVIGSVSASSFTGSFSGSGAVSPRGTVVVTTANIADQINELGSVPLGKTWMLLAIQADRACRVRLYSTSGSRSDDLARAIGTDPSASAGVLADFVFTSANTLIASPIVMGANMEGSVSSSTSYIIQNRSGGASTVTITFTRIAIE